MDSAKCRILLGHFRALELFLMLYMRDEYGHKRKTILVRRSQLVMKSTIPFPILREHGVADVLCDTAFAEGLKSSADCDGETCSCVTG